MQTREEKRQDIEENIATIEENITTNTEDIETLLENKYAGTTHATTVSGSWVRLMTITITNNYKTCSVLFYITCVQSSSTLSSLVSINVAHTTSGTMNAKNFSLINFTSSTVITDRLVAVNTGDDVMEIYYQMGSNQSPNLNIIGISKTENTDGYGEVEVDCDTVVSDLPDGTATYVTSLI